MDDQWLGSRDGFSALRATFDALVSAKTIGDEDVDLEYVTFDRSRSDRRIVWLPREDQLADVFSGSGCDRSLDSGLPLADAA